MQRLWLVGLALASLGMPGTAQAQYNWNADFPDFCGSMGCGSFHVETRGTNLTMAIDTDEPLVYVDMSLPGADWWLSDYKLGNPGCCDEIGGYSDAFWAWDNYWYDVGWSYPDEAMFGHNVFYFALNRPISYMDATLSGRAIGLAPYDQTDNEMCPPEQYPDWDPYSCWEYTSENVLEASVSAVQVTPEPASLLLLGTGLIGVIGAARRRMHIGVRKTVSRL